MSRKKTPLWYGEPACSRAAVKVKHDSQVATCHSHRSALAEMRRPGGQVAFKYKHANGEGILLLSAGGLTAAGDIWAAHESCCEGSNSEVQLEAARCKHGAHLRAP